MLGSGTGTNVQPAATGSKSVPVKSVLMLWRAAPVELPSPTALASIAPVRSASSRVALDRFALFRFALFKYAPNRFAPVLPAAR